MATLKAMEDTLLHPAQDSERAWVIVDAPGITTALHDRDAWLATWRERVGEIRAAKLPKKLRRDDLDRLVGLNRRPFSELVTRGDLDAVAEAAGFIVKAQNRLRA